MYDRQLTPQQTLNFGVSGMLYRNGMIMFDRETNSLWSHILGQAIAGEYKGTTLTFIPALQTDWKSWHERHPETLVVNPSVLDRDGYTGYYAIPRQAGVLGRTNTDERLLTKEYVIGVRLAGQVKAYPFSVLNEHPVVNDTISHVDIAVFFNKDTASGTVFNRQLADGTVLSFETSSTLPNQAVDTQTGSVWDILTGQAISGPLQDTQLAQVPVTYAFWFGWADYHGESSVYQP